MHVLSILGDIPSSPHALEVSSILTDQEYSNPDHLHMYLCATTFLLEWPRARADLSTSYETSCFNLILSCSFAPNL